MNNKEWHYSEAVVNGVLCWKGSYNPGGGTWMQFSPQELTARIQKLTAN
jgi:hypothetical protein